MPAAPLSVTLIVAPYPGGLRVIRSVLIKEPSAPFCPLSPDAHGALADAIGGHEDHKASYVSCWGRNCRDGDEAPSTRLTPTGHRSSCLGRYVAFQAPEVAFPVNLFADILRMNAELRSPPIASTRSEFGCRVSD